MSVQVWNRYLWWACGRRDTALAPICSIWVNRHVKFLYEFLISYLTHSHVVPL